MKDRTTNVVIGLLVFILFLLVAPYVLAETVFLKEEFTSGLYRTCVYEGSRGDYMMTIGVEQVCPYSVNID